MTSSLSLVRVHGNGGGSWRFDRILHAPVGARLRTRMLPRLMALPGARAVGRQLLVTRLMRPWWRRRLFRAPVPAAYLDRFFDEYRACAVFARMFDLVTAEWFESLRPTVVPAALLWGGDDRVLPPDHVEDYRALLPGAVVRVVPGWGHFPMVDAPEAYAREVVELAGRITTRKEGR